jgi:hypothetical protein
MRQEPRYTQERIARCFNFIGICLPTWFVVDRKNLTCRMTRVNTADTLPLFRQKEVLSTRGFECYRASRLFHLAGQENQRSMTRLIVSQLWRTLDSDQYLGCRDLHNKRYISRRAQGLVHYSRSAYRVARAFPVPGSP